MSFRAYDIDTARMLSRVYESVLEEAGKARPDIPPERWAALKTHVIENLISAADVGERDPDRLRAYALGNIRNFIGGAAPRKPTSLN
ncbi:MAG: hypothetical protein GC201_16395 [Alphaproteobacteria bacterium]|nr:hypothetical protein [Alphaproteobacteria bacterium]